MLEFLNLIVSHPYADLIAVLSITAAYGFIKFLWGFTGYVLAHGDKEHQQNARVQMVSGLGMFTIILIIWSIFRWIASFFT
jgi:hypothetical protein